LEAAEDAFNVTLYSYAYGSQHGSHACTSSTLNEIGTPKLTSLLSSVQEKPVVETVDFDSLSESVLSAAKTTSPTKVSHLVLSLSGENTAQGGPERRHGSTVCSSNITAYTEVICFKLSFGHTKPRAGWERL
jgi:hypothetical protein